MKMSRLRTAGAAALASAWFTTLGLIAGAVDTRAAGDAFSNATPSSVIAQAKAEDTACPTLLRHAFTPIQGGGVQSMCQYQGKVIVVVNTASQCGYTYQYEGLEALYRKYRERGLVVIGFPSNDFGGQEPGSNKEIAEFCRTVYGVQFPMFEKQSGSRLAANPFYGELIAKTGQAPGWNFHKYIIDRSGARVSSFKSDTEPTGREITALIERLLAERPPALRG